MLSYKRASASLTPSGSYILELSHDSYFIFSVQSWECDSHGKKREANPVNSGRVRCKKQNMEWNGMLNKTWHTLWNAYIACSISDRLQANCNILLLLP